MRVHVAALLALLATLWSAPAHTGPIRILGASQIRIDPIVRADATAVDVVVTALDDNAHPRPVHGRVSLRWAPEGHFGPHAPVRDAQTDRDGRASFTLPVDAGDEALQVQATLAATDSFASSQTAIELIDLAAPFVRIDQPEVEPVVPVDAASFTVTVHLVVATVRLENVARLPLTLRVDDEPVATTQPDASGYAEITVPGDRVREPGFHTLRADYVRGDNRVSSPLRRFVSRAATSLDLIRAPIQGPDGISLLVALATRSAPIGPGAAVRILAGSQLVGAGLTGDHGTLELTLDPEVSSRADLVVRATFAPTEPWFLASESTPLRLTPPAPARVRWTLVAVPLGVAVFLLLALQLRRRGGPGIVAPVAMKPLEEGAAVERLTEGPATAIRVRLRAVDRATDASIETARARWLRPALGDQPVDALVEVDTAGFEVELTAEGFAPRTLTGELPRGGEYAVRVALRSWREELFERVRRWMRQSGVSGLPVLPTPRELLAGRGASRRNEDLVALVESGAYGPEGADAESVRAADALGTGPSNAPPVARSVRP